MSELINLIKKLKIKDDSILVLLLMVKWNILKRDIKQQIIQELTCLLHFL